MKIFRRICIELFWLAIGVLCGAIVYWWLNLNGYENIPFQYDYRGQIFEFQFESIYPGLFVASLAIVLIFTLRSIIQFFRVLATAVVAAAGWLGVWWLLNKYIPVLEQICNRLDGDLSGLSVAGLRGSEHSDFQFGSTLSEIDLENLHCDSFLPELQSLQIVALVLGILIFVLAGLRFFFRSKT